MMNTTKKKKEEVLFKLALVLTKILEVWHWVGTIVMLVIFVLSIVFQNQLSALLADPNVAVTGELQLYDLEIVYTDAAKNTPVLLYTMFALAGCLVLPLWAMIFRNCNHILKNTRNASPFSSDNIRMLRQIGIFAIAVPVVSFLVGIATMAVSVVSGIGSTEIATGMDGVILGILVFCLTQAFTYGAHLEDDVEGLL